MMLAQSSPTIKPDVYQRKAIATRKRRAEADARLTAEFAKRQRAFQAKIDAIIEAKKVRP